VSIKSGHRQIWTTPKFKNEKTIKSPSRRVRIIFYTYTSLGTFSIFSRDHSIIERAQTPSFRTRITPWKPIWSSWADDLASRSSRNSTSIVGDFDETNADRCRKRVDDIFIYAPTSHHEIESFKCWSCIFGQSSPTNNNNCSRRLVDDNNTTISEWINNKVPRWRARQLKDILYGKITRVSLKLH